MEFKCTNNICNMIFSVKNVRYRFSEQFQKLVHDIKCPSCNSITEDVSKFEGFGQAKRSLKNASKSYFDRGPKRKPNSSRLT